MGDFLWTFAVEEMLKKVLKVAREQAGLAWGFQKHLSKLQKWLLKAEAFLRNINTRKLHHDSVRMWVDDLRHLVYQADDLLDEIVYEHLRQKVQTRKMKKVCDFFSPSTNVLIFRLNMAKKMMTLIALLEKHYLEAAPLGLVGNENVRPEIDVISQYRETISELEDHKIVGRDVEVESIVKQVIDASNNQLTSILPIVGDSKEVLLRELQKEMLGQTYFLVLDDVWNENSFLWGELKYCLLKITGNSKNSIVVTTRSAEVAKIMGTCPGHLLSKLSDDHCWSLFKESANVYGLSMTSNLGIIQKELVKKIGGVPLVAQVLGRTVKFEGDVEKWEETLKSVLRIPVQEEDFVLSILKLSVDRLPSSALKQCFSYCSIFPKDFVFEKQELIQMWMAQGFLQPQEGRNMTMETVGDIYFKILLSHCLFQDAHETRTEEYKMHDLVYGTRTEEYKMHDLVHDIAMAISRDQNLQLNPSNISKKELQKKEIKNVACKLRTIDFNQKIPHNIGQLIFFDVKIRNFVCLRILKISKMSSEKLPKSIDQLKHLRYLEIASYSTRLKFPESIVSLHNLQTLKFLYSFVEEFPMNFSNLVSLRHLKLWGNVEQTPPHLSQLTQLQTLSHFVIGFEEGRKIIELGPLKNLQDSLNLLCLEKVESKEEAKGANLAEKENLKELNLSWSMKRKDNDSYNDLEVLEGLQPNQNLQILRIHDFTERRLPNKIFVENLIEIGLYGCDNCEKLPMLGQLNNLKKLEICSFDGVQIIDNEFYGNDPNQRRFFPKLEKFAMGGMMNLEQWEEHLPSLKKITLVEGKLSNNSVKQIPQQLQHLTSLEFLSIENFGGIEALPEWLGNLVCLQTLCFLCCRNLKKLPSTEAMLRLTKLNKLYACECPMLLLEEGDPERAKLSHFPNVLAHRNTFESCRFF
uniref:Disease resistance protein RGA3 n=1 Tax=Cucumis melo TaxID=3656 RepID=A0A9I9DPY0_CUCME